jgi:hypothetical protein
MKIVAIATNYILYINLVKLKGKLSGKQNCITL